MEVMRCHDEASFRTIIKVAGSLKAEIERQAEAEGRLISTFVQRVMAAYIVSAKAATTT